MKKFTQDRRERSFTKSRDRSPRFGRDDSAQYGGRSSGKFERRDPDRSFEKRMHQVTCAKCGERCEVPFRPTEGKPVYCSNCFRKNDKNDSYETKGPAPSNNQLDQINKKLDQILQILQDEL